MSLISIFNNHCCVNSIPIEETANEIKVNFKIFLLKDVEKSHRVSN